MFPEDTEDIQRGSSEKTSNVGKSFLFDFEKGDFVLNDGKLQPIVGIAAVKGWIQKVLKTQKFKFKIYETGEIDEYGTETLLEIVMSDHPQAFIQAEIQRVITDALLKNTEILSLQEFAFTKGKRALAVSFRVNSIYGSTKEEVKV